MAGLFAGESRLSAAMPDGVPLGELACKLIFVARLRELHPEP